MAQTAENRKTSDHGTLKRTGGGRGREPAATTKFSAAGRGVVIMPSLQSRASGVARADEMC